MTQILIPTDFSENSWNAIKYGLELFKKSRCTFYLLNITPLPPYSGAGTAVRAASTNFENYVLDESKKDLQKLVKRIEKLPLNTKHTFVTIALHDYFVDAIKRETEENEKICSENLEELSKLHKKPSPGGGEGKRTRLHRFTREISNRKTMTRLVHNDHLCLQQWYFDE